MNLKTGRNEPCPCGSGRKYKQCHGRAANDAPTPIDDGRRAVERTMQWLGERRRKAFNAARDGLFRRFLIDALRASPRELDEEVLGLVQINLTEWLIADGSLDVKGRETRTIDDVLGAEGPNLTPAQRQRMEQMRLQPLALYTITAVRPGAGLTLCDALDVTAAPVEVDEDIGSQTLRPGMLIGARLLQLDAQRELSGALYVFGALAAGTVVEAVRTAAANAAADGERQAVGAAIIDHWVRQFTAPPALPGIIDAASGEPMLLVTDHYRVLDAGALAAALAACADVAGDAQHGWRRESSGSDGLVRSSVVVNPGRQADRIEVFYRTRTQADEGRAWFEGVVGAAVTHLTREITDPQGALRAGGGDSAAAEDRGTERGALPPHLLAQAFEQIMRKHYAGWCDEPIPALGGQTPRQAIATPAGLERVKGLLRSYEDGERQQSAAQGRPAFSFRFLWEALGIDD